MRTSPNEPTSASSIEHWQTFVADAHELGVSLNLDQLQMFQRYTILLQSANEQFNLTAMIDLPSILTKLHLDSLAIIPPIARSMQMDIANCRSQAWRATDVGAGAGIPGLPILIAWPSLFMTLIESTQKKAAFLGNVVADLGLSASVISDRAEVVGQQVAHRERYDLALARAVAPLPALVELTLPLLRVGGLAALPKGPNVGKELTASKAALAKLGGEIRDVITLQVPRIKETRILVIIAKIRPTPSNYPRRPGLPLKSPIMAE